MEMWNQRCITNMVRTGIDITRHSEGTTKEANRSEDAEIDRGSQAGGTSFGPRYGNIILPVKDPANIETGGRPCVVDDGHRSRPIRQPSGSQDIAIQEDGLREVSQRKVTRTHPQGAPLRQNSC